MFTKGFNKTANIQMPTGQAPQGTKPPPKTNVQNVGSMFTNISNSPGKAQNVGPTDT